MLGLADIDPAYGYAFSEALMVGVEALCYAWRVGAETIELQPPLPIYTSAPTSLDRSHGCKTADQTR